MKSQQAALAVAVANRKQVDVLRSQIVSTQAQLKQAIAMETEDETQLGYTKIYAPIDGIVSVRVAKQGEVVQEGSPIVTLVDIDDLWVRADVEETYIDSIHFGRRLPIRLPSGDKRSRARCSSRAWKATSPRSATSAAPSATSRRSRSRSRFPTQSTASSPG